MKLALVGLIAISTWAQTLINGSRTIAGPVNYCSDAGSTDAYACSLSPAITAYVTGAIYHFRANTANTGAATLNLNGLGAKTIVKVAGGVTTALADNDIRANQGVTVMYDGTNLQMQSTLGNASAGGGGGDTIAESSGIAITTVSGVKYIAVDSLTVPRFDLVAGALDFPSIAANGGVQDLTLSLATAQQGDGCFTGQDPTLPSTISITCFVTAGGGSITVRARNHSASPVDPGSFGFTAIYLRRF